MSATCERDASRPRRVSRLGSSQAAELEEVIQKGAESDKTEWIVTVQKKAAQAAETNDKRTLHRLAMMLGTLTLMFHRL